MCIRDRCGGILASAAIYHRLATSTNFGCFWLAGSLAHAGALTDTGLPTSAEETSFAKDFMLAIKARNQARNPPQAHNRRGCVCSSHYHNQGELHGKHNQQRGVAGGKGECE